MTDTNKKGMSVAIMAVILGLPIVWYLFLQFFGENKFDLPVLGQAGNTCFMGLGPSVAVNEKFSKLRPNELRIVQEKMTGAAGLSLHFMNFDPCNLDKDMYLIDGNGKLRGGYELSREGVDRWKVEVDIYLMNLRDGKRD